MKLEEVIERLKDDVKYADLRDIVDDDCTICFTEDVETVLQEIEHLQKENEKYISGELMTRNQAKHFEEINKKCYIHKDKIREKIEEIKDKKAEDIFITSTESKLNTIFALEDLLGE